MLLAYQNQTVQLHAKVNVEVLEDGRSSIVESTVGQIHIQWKYTSRLRICRQKCRSMLD